MITEQPPHHICPGRPRSLNDAKRREICALVSTGCSLAHAARYVRCALSTIHRERRANEEFRAQLYEAELSSRFTPLDALRKAMEDDWRAAAWFLERTQPDQFARNAPPAFKPKQLRTLVAAVSKVIEESNASPYQKERLHDRIATVLRQALGGPTPTGPAVPSHSITYPANVLVPNISENESKRE